MGMSTHVVAIKPPDSKWKAMKKIWDSCKDAEVDPPTEVLEFFDFEPPDDEGVVLDLSYKGHEALEEWSDRSRTGYQIHLDHLPKDVKIIRFYNAW